MAPEFAEARHILRYGRHRIEEVALSTSHLRKVSTTCEPLRVASFEAQSRTNDMITSELIEEMPDERLEMPFDVSEGGSPADEPWSVSAAELLQRFDVDPKRGLSDAEVAKRRGRYGRNELRHYKKRSLLSILVAQFRSLIVALLVVTAGTAFLFGEIIEAWAIGAVILLNAALGFVTELRAVRSMEALRKLGRVTSRVRRNGSVQEVSAQGLVPGDIVVLEGGDVVSADLRIAESSQLQADESPLTGESMPVAKSADAVSGDTPLAERSSMLYKGTAVTRGSGEGVVVHIGMDTELGHISALVESADEEKTPLEVRLNALGHKLIWVTIGIATVVSAIGLIRGKNVFLMIETGIALAVASIPEGLPIVATIALARGVRIMAHRNALVNRLSSVETLGSAGVICTDKTGTLTENRMTVARLLAGEEDVDVEAHSPLRGDVMRAALEAAVLCNNAELGNDSNAGDRDVHKISRTGDPMEVALLDIGRRAGIERSALVAEQPEEREEAFETGTKMMATFHRTDSGFRVAVKGAPEEILGVSSHWRAATGSEPLDEEARRTWLKRNERLAGDGLRVIAVAEKYVDDVGVEPYADLTFLGLIGMADPPREDVRPALETCRVAGINVVMVTGDQPITALRVAEAVGLIDGDDAEVVRGADLKPTSELTEADRARLLSVPVFARVTPEQKLNLIELHQEAGQIVAMTGDGVNDAPALKKADIGIAMGLRGTQVAREASDMVLRDDAFSSIVAAVEQGRVIFANIRRFVFYLLSCNVSEVMVVGLATLLGGPLPILPLQILFLNLVTDIFPALALGMGKGDPLVMERPPRKAEEAILKPRHWRAIAAYGGLITGSVLAVLYVALNILHLELSEAVTASFLTLALAQLWHVFNMRARGSRFVRNEVTTNPFVWGAVAICLALIGSAVYVPTLAAVLQLVSPGPDTWLLVISFSFVPFGVGQTVLSSSRHQTEANEADSPRRRKA